MVFSVSNDGIEWSLDVGPDSVTLTVKYLFQEMTICSREIPLAACSFLSSQLQDFLNNHLPQDLITPSQQGPLELGYEVLSSLGAQNMDTTGQQSSDLEDIEFHWKNFPLE